jgi:hypothetical protein
MLHLRCTYVALEMRDIKVRLLEVIPVVLPRLAPDRLVLGQIRPQRLRVAAVRWPSHTHRAVPCGIRAEAAVAQWDRPAAGWATPKGREGGRANLLTADGHWAAVSAQRRDARHQVVAVHHGRHEQCAVRRERLRGVSAGRPNHSSSRIGEPQQRRQPNRRCVADRRPPIEQRRRLTLQPSRRIRSHGCPH